MKQLKDEITKGQLPSSRGVGQKERLETLGAGDMVPRNNYPSPQHPQSSKKKTITAILEMGILKGKMIIERPYPEIQLAVFLPLKVKYAEETTPELPNTTPRLVFEYRERISENQYLYTLKKIK